MRPVRSRRLLRHLTGPARDRARPAVRAPYIRSFEPGEDWFYDYRTGDVLDGPELAGPASHPSDQQVPGPAGRVPADWADQIHR
jgi:hypothetical protein